MGTPLIDSHGRCLHEVRFRLACHNPFKLIYKAPDSVRSGDPASDPLNFDEALIAAACFAEIGAERVHLTCPTLDTHVEMTDLVKGLKSIPGLNHVSLTTMGTDLASQTGALHLAGLDEIRVNLDSLRPGRYTKITGTGLLMEAQSGFEAALQTDFLKVIVNMIVMRGVNADELFEFVAMVQDTPAEMRFIELVPFSGAGWMTSAVYPWQQMKDSINSQVPLVALENDEHSEIHHYRIPDHTGLIGFVPSLSETYCATCNRARVTVDGRIQSCQFSPPDAKFRDALRSGKRGGELVDVLRTVLGEKPKGRPELEQLMVLATGGSTER